MKAAPTCFGSRKTIIREPHPVLLHGAQYTRRVKICRHDTNNINNDTHIGTRYVILAKHWMWLPDDGFM